MKPIVFRLADLAPPRRIQKFRYRQAIKVVDQRRPSTPFRLRLVINGRHPVPWKMLFDRGRRVMELRVRTPVPAFEDFSTEKISPPD